MNNETRCDIAIIAQVSDFKISAAYNTIEDANFNFYIISHPTPTPTLCLVNFEVFLASLSI